MSGAWAAQIPQWSTWVQLLALFKILCPTDAHPAWWQVLAQVFRSRPLTWETQAKLQFLPLALLGPVVMDIWGASLCLSDKFK